MYKILGFMWLHEVFCPASAFATADSDEARNPQRFIHVSVMPKAKNSHKYNDLTHKEEYFIQIDFNLLHRYLFLHHKDFKSIQLDL
jgi:hypothetical protein